MPNTATRAWTSRALRRKGKYLLPIWNRVLFFLTIHSFGWVNASYVYGLQLVNAHMKRALGTLTEWEDYARATQAFQENEGESSVESIA